MSKAFKVLVLPGDGVGPEVTAQAVSVLERASSLYGYTVECDFALVGDTAYDGYGDDLPAVTLEKAARTDAILVGAVGGRTPHSEDTWSRGGPGLIRLRRELDLFANLRPVKSYPAIFAAAPLKPERLKGADLLIVRELSGGIYYGQPRSLGHGGLEREACNTMSYSASEVARVAHIAFQLARTRRRHLTSVGKSNVLETSMLWRDVIDEVSPEYQDVTVRHEIVDSGAYQIASNPSEYDVVVTANLFGDILSDIAAVATGSLGMLPSASIGHDRLALYEPVHGSAPDIAGRDIANPIGAILSCAMLTKHSMHLPAAGQRIEEAVANVLGEGFRTADIQHWSEDGETVVVGCQEMGEKICNAVGRS